MCQLMASMRSSRAEKFWAVSRPERPLESWRSSTTAKEPPLSKVLFNVLRERNSHKNCYDSYFQIYPLFRLKYYHIYWINLICIGLLLQEQILAIVNYVYNATSSKANSSKTKYLITIPGKILLMTCNVLFLNSSIDQRWDLDARAHRVPADHDGGWTAKAGGPDQVPEKRSTLFKSPGWNSRQTLRCVRSGVSQTHFVVTCDQTEKIFFQYFAIYYNENMPNGQKFAI